MLRSHPNHSSVLYFLASIAHQRGQNEAAADLIRRALRNNPRNPVYHNDLAVALQHLGKFTEAIQCYQQALRLNPNLPRAYYNIGLINFTLGKYGEAIGSYREALQQEPNLLEAHINLGVALSSQKRLNEAVSCYMKAIELDPGYAKAYYNLGVAFHDQGNLDGAVSCHRKALELERDCPGAHSYLVWELRQSCAWEELDGLTEQLEKINQRTLDEDKKASETPFMNVTRSSDLSSNLRLAKPWSTDVAASVSVSNAGFTFDKRRNRKAKITVGYLSSDFRDHATAHLMLGLFRIHDRRFFRIHCYSYGQDDASRYRRQIERECDQFVDLTEVSYLDSATRIYEDEVDILVDLKGYTEGNRLGICALRPAPIQVTYLGFPGTTGADFFDYIITDRTVTPEDHARYYSENFVYLPDCYQINDDTQVISDKRWDRANLGLLEKGFIFSSFNQGYKIEAALFATWMSILRQVPDSVLWLQPGNEIAETNLKRRAIAQGIDSKRLVFGTRLPKQEHLSRLKLSDLVLDTCVCNGHTTTSDALWAGVPVITVQGSHFASRVSSSILKAIGLPELITHGLEEYENLAVRLANNPDQLQGIRKKLESNRLVEPLFDTPRFARNLENAYQEMWEVFLNEGQPRQIRVLENRI